MGKQLAALIICLVLCSCFLTSSGAENAAPEMSVAQSDSPKESQSVVVTPIEFYINLLNLKIYDAVLTDVSACKDDQECLQEAARLKSWKCVSEVCGGTNKEISNASQCFGSKPDEIPQEQWNTVGSKLCGLLAGSNPKEIKQTLNFLPDADEPDLVRSVAVAKALKGSASACTDYIKEFIGAYGRDTSLEWFKTRAGCRILAKETTREQEERDFYIWLGVYRNFNCAAFFNAALSPACQNSSAASPSPFAATPESKEPFQIKEIVDQIGLVAYDAAMRDLAACQKDESCLQRAKRINVARCIAKVCPGQGSEKNPASCFDDSFGSISSGTRDQINASFCPTFSPSDDSLKDLKGYLPNIPDNELAEFEAYALAAGESSTSCQNYIKHYVGPFGPQWNSELYRVLSGCRIIGGESSLGQEENDFYTWIGVKRKFSCNNIVDTEFKNVCSSRDITQDFFRK
ncbi:MAG: hypothetical protein KA403_03305 [Candidatus Omnitrophica bacterium]|nr:hypothetical protein [Candidatus Omnitrophota bacterium]